VNCLRHIRASDPASPICRLASVRSIQRESHGIEFLRCRRWTREIGHSLSPVNRLYSLWLSATSGM
jgi:hypothetical protein